jgi:hypothetical protein
VRVGVTDDRQPRRHYIADMTGTMPRLRRSVDDVALVGHEDRDISNLELVLAFQNEPEFRPG